MIAESDTSICLVGANDAAAIVAKRVDRNDHAELLAMKPKHRNKVKAYLIAMELIDELIRNNHPRRTACQKVAREANLPVKLSFSMLYKMHPIWQKGGHKPMAKAGEVGPYFSARDWRLFAPNWTNGSGGQPQEFIDHVRRLYAETTRADAIAGVHARLLDDWAQNLEVPGYGCRADWCARHARPFVPHVRFLRSSDFPDGWSLSNLRKLLPKSKAQRALFQRGEHAAHDHWADVLMRDRSNLRFLETITFDDVRFDIKVWMVVNGKVQVVYPYGLFAIDVATGCAIAHGIGGGTTRDVDAKDGPAGTRRSLSMRDTRFLLLQILETYGHAPWTTKILLENASAALTKTDKEAFLAFMGGKLEFEETGVVRGKLVKSDFVEQGGMPWQKGWVEAWFRLLHCRINHLPGTTGRRYDLSPGNADQRDKYVIRQVSQALEKGVDPRELHLPILSLNEFHAVLDHYVNRINWRTNHNLQGFRDVAEFEYEPGRFIRMDTDDASAIVPVGEGGEYSLRREAPIERAMRLRQNVELSKPHPATLIPLYLDKRRATIRRERITLQCKAISPDPLIFRDADSAPWLAKLDGQEVMAFVREDGGGVHLAIPEPDGADWQYLGFVRNQARVDMTDEHALHRAMGEVHRGRQEVRNDVAELLAPREAELAEMRRHNAELLDPTPQSELRNPQSPGEALGARMASAETKAAKKAQVERERREAVRSQPTPLSAIIPQDQEDDEDEDWGFNNTLPEND